MRVVDNGSSGSPPDEFFSDPIATNCASVASDLIDGGQLVSGDIAVNYPIPGNIVGTSFTHLDTLHLVYDRFVNGTIVHWTVTTNGIGTIASRQFSAIGGGSLGSKTYHFLDLPLGTTLEQNAQSHVTLTWGNSNRYTSSPKPRLLTPRRATHQPRRAHATGVLHARCARERRGHTARDVMPRRRVEPSFPQFAVKALTRRAAMGSYET